MSGLTAKIVSSWLTETDERGLQVAFCHWLMSRGFRVIHSTSHNAMEVGKDVVALGPDGTLNAYQLKAHRGTHLGMSDFRADVQPQLYDLSSTAVVIPGIEPRMPDHVFVVANSDFHEHVHREIDDRNRASRGRWADIQIIGRSQLLSDLVDLAEALLPDDVVASHAMLELLLNDGRGEFPIEKFAPLLEMLATSLPSESGQSGRRRLYAKMAVVTEVAAGPWRKIGNHLGVFQAYGTCLMAASLGWSLHGKHDDDFESLDFIASAAVGSLESILSECENATVADIAHANEYDQVGLAKVMHFLGLASLCALMCGAGNTDVDGHPYVGKCKKLIGKLGSNRYIWGEAAVPHALCVGLFLERYATGSISNEYWTWCVRSVVDINSEGSNRSFHPWDRLEGDNARYLLGIKKRESPRVLDSYWTDPVIRVAVRLNLKSLVKSIWPMAVSQGICRFLTTDEHGLYRLKNDSGMNTTIHRPLPVRWSQLVEEAKKSTTQDCIYSRRPYWYLIAVFVYPHRVNADILGALLPTYVGGVWH